MRTIYNENGEVCEVVNDVMEYQIEMERGATPESAEKR